jgi:hypothetical protein
MATPLSAKTWRGSGSADRQACAAKNCFATFSAGSPKPDETRHCNRAGPDGGHTNRWDGKQWQVVTGQMQH